MRLGDIEGICERIESQARLAKRSGARVLCTPSPLFGGLMPNLLIEEKNFEHDVVCGLSALAARIEELDLVVLVPAVVAFEHAPLFEVFMLKEGRAIPVRSLLAYRRGGAVDDIWAPPVFDIDDVRFAITFDMRRDLALLPPGCDVLVYFQSNAFDVNDEETSAVAAVADGYFAQEVAEKGVWLAWMAPVGGFEEVAFTGGSFVMDDGGRVVAAAPCFEEALLVHDVSRGTFAPAIAAHDLPHYQREEWLWEALRLHLADTVAARDRSRAVLLLEGDLPSSLAAALCVDALGSRNVTGLLVERSDVFTPAQEAAERARVELVRGLAHDLKIQLIEHAAPDVARLVDRDARGLDERRLEARIAGLYLEDAAVALNAVSVSSLTKTDAALAAPALAGSYAGEIAPFGDVYLTMLEFLARVRAHAGSALPASLISLAAVRLSLSRILAAALDAFAGPLEYRERIARALATLEPAQVDEVLEEHVNYNRALDDIALAASHREAVALLLMFVRTGEGARRRLPATPIVSASSFIERAWPASLVWIDTGRSGEEAATVWGLVEAEAERFAVRGEDQGERVRGEIMSVIASLLGLPVEQLDGTPIEEELLRRLRHGFASETSGDGLPDGPGVSGALPPGMRGPGFSFFSVN